MSLRKKIFLYSIIPILIILSSTIISNSYIQDSQDSSYWVEHTHKVISEAYELQGIIVDLETGLRGYVITGVDEFLEPFNSAKLRWEKEIQVLKNTVSDNPRQVEKLSKIEDIIAQWFKSAAYPEITAIQTGNFDSAKSLVIKKSGKKLIDSIRGLLNDFM